MSYAHLHRPEPLIKVGQTWERLKDGVRVEITAYDAYWDDARYKKVGAAKGRGRIFGDYLRRRYRLIKSPAPDSPSASGTPAEVDGQSSGPQSARADSVGGAS